eukprot:5591098-Amphidinium_carterae.1
MGSSQNNNNDRHINSNSNVQLVTIMIVAFSVAVVYQIVCCNLAQSRLMASTYVVALNTEFAMSFVYSDGLSCFPDPGPWRQYRSSDRAIGPTSALNTPEKAY